MKKSVTFERIQEHLEHLQRELQFIKKITRILAPPTIDKSLIQALDLKQNSFATSIENSNCDTQLGVEMDVKLFVTSLNLEPPTFDWLLS